MPYAEAHQQHVAALEQFARGLDAFGLRDVLRRTAELHRTVTEGYRQFQIEESATRILCAFAAHQPDDFADVLREQLDFRRSPTDIAYAEPVMTALRETLGASGFATRWAQGWALSPDKALNEALALRVDSKVGATPAGRWSASRGLTRREVEILRLIAAGHTNRAVGELLFISPATVSRHIANIYKKLMIESRAQAAAFVHQHGLD